jgi:hypothetical protein
MGFITGESQIDQVPARGQFLLPPRCLSPVRHRRDMTMDDEIREYKLTVTDKTLARCLDDVKGSWKREIVTRALIKYERERDSKIAYS